MPLLQTLYSRHRCQEHPRKYKDLPEINDRIEEAVHKNYLYLIDLADAAFLDQKYEEALDLYENAKKVKDTNEVVDLIDGTKGRIYEDLLMQGSEEMERAFWTNTDP